MAQDSQQPYAVKGNQLSDQAETSTANRGAAMIQMRILIELQVISMLLANQTGGADNLRQLRQDVADSIT